MESNTIAPIHIVAMSGGKDSTAMALRLRELYPERAFQYVITPTGDELPEMIEHWNRLQAILGRFVVLSCGYSLEGLIRKQSALPNWRQRWCTRMLKIEPFQAYLLKNMPCVSYVGLRADEEERKGMEFKASDGVDVRFPLQEWGWGLSDVLEYLDKRGIEIPERTDCGACFYQTLGEWWRLYKNYPTRYAEYEAMEADISALRGKETTFRSPGRDSWPASLSAVRERFEAGHTPRHAGQADLFKNARCAVCSM